jgi:hypothetical protein
VAEVARESRFGSRALEGGGAPSNMGGERSRPEAL